MGTRAGLGTSAGMFDSFGARPMTSNMGAGYTSATARPAMFNPLNTAARGPAPPLKKRSEGGPEFKAREYEREIHELLEASAQAQANAGKNDSSGEALDKAKKAVQRERVLTKHRDRHNLQDQMSVELKFAVYFNLANQYQKNGMLQDALSTLSHLVRNKAYSHGGRLRVNMGNIYFAQENYPAAIKMYRMAMDQIGSASKQMRYRILQNIGIAFVKLGHFPDAIQSFEAVMGAAPDAHTGLNLILCYYALGDQDKMKRGFNQLLAVPEFAEIDRHSEEMEARRVAQSEKGKRGSIASASLTAFGDEAREWRRKRRDLSRIVLQAAKLIAKVIRHEAPNGSATAAGVNAGSRNRSSRGMNTTLDSDIEAGDPGIDDRGRNDEEEDHDYAMSGYDWVIERCKDPPITSKGIDGFVGTSGRKMDGGTSRLESGRTSSAGATIGTVAGAAGVEASGSGESLFARLAMELQIAKGIAYLKQKQFERAIEVFKNFQRDETALIGHAATNLSFVYFLEGDIKNAKKYAQKAIDADRFNPCALVNRANCFFVDQDYDQAKTMYEDAMSVDADCTEAIYNLGLCYMRMNNLPEALDTFRKVHRIIPSQTEVIYQIANIYEMMGDLQSSSEWFKIFQGAVPTDSTVLARMGMISRKEDNDLQAFHNYIESYRHCPTNLDIISWLGVWYVQHEHYKEAVKFFTRAAELDPGQMKWRLMVASCYRRMRNLRAALDIYKDLHVEAPDNIECLQYLCAIYKELDEAQQLEVYSEKLRTLQRAMRNPHLEHGNAGALSAEVHSHRGGDSPQSPNRTRPVEDEYAVNVSPPVVQSLSLSSAGPSPARISPTHGQATFRERRNSIEDDWGGDDLGDDLLPS